jgi:hypothetical protein
MEQLNQLEYKMRKRRELTGDPRTKRGFSNCLGICEKSKSVCECIERRMEFYW